MSLRVSVIKIDDYYGDAESQKVQGEGKEEELGEQWNCFGSRRQQFRDQQHVHNESYEDADRQGDLLPCLGWKIEHAGAEEANKNAWDHKIGNVKQGHSLQNQMEGHLTTQLPVANRTPATLGFIWQQFTVMTFGVDRSCINR